MPTVNYGKNSTRIGNVDASKQPVFTEGLVTSTYFPGTLVEKSSNGNLTVTATSNTTCHKGLLVLSEMGQDLNGQTATTAYTAGASGKAGHLISGEIYNMRVATGQNITTTRTPMTSNGDGTLVIATPATDNVLCYALEIVNTSGVTRVACEVV